MRTFPIFRPLILLSWDAFGVEGQERKNNPYISQCNKLVSIQTAYRPTQRREIPPEVHINEVATINSDDNSSPRSGPPVSSSLLTEKNWFEYHG